MINIQDFLRNTQVFRKFEVDDLQFVEVLCRVDDDSTAQQWWHNNFFSYPISGRLLVKTTRGEYVQVVGDCVFAKKGSVVSAQHLRSEEHTSELQSRENIVCRLLLEKKNNGPTSHGVWTKTLQK